MEKKMDLRFVFKGITIIVTIFLVLFVLYGLRLEILQDKMLLVDYIKKFGIIAPLFFISLQAFQVVFPVIPGGASCLAGVLAFGSAFGFVYNYIGLIIGSLIAFYLSKKYGLSLVRKIFKEETIQKYLKYINDSRFDTIFFLCIFIPGLPDDIMCYIAGLSKMNYKTFLISILIGKPLSLLLYNFFVTNINSFVFW